MNIALPCYLLLGYVIAFNVCCRMERQRVELSLFDTGFIILLFTVGWLPIDIMNVLTEAALNVYCKIKVSNQTKENRHE